MDMASRALSPLLPRPSWFRRRPHAPSPDPEEARWAGRLRPLEEQYKRRIAELRPPRSPARPDFSQALACETQKRQWINEQKRLIAEEMRRAGAPDPRWNDGGKDDSRKGRTPVIEQLSAFEIKKRRWMAEHQRSIARARRRSGLEEAWRQRKVHPPVSSETADDPAKQPSVRYADRFGPGSDAAFLKSVLDDGKSGGGVDRDSGAERDEAHKRRQRYLRNYCPFQREEGSVREEVEERKRIEPDEDDAEIERSVPVPVLPANGPGSVDGEFLMKSVIQKNQWAGRRRSDEYYAMRRQVLQSYKFSTDESEKASVGVAQRSACATTRNNCPSHTEEEAEEESVPENRKPEEPDDAETGRTVQVLPDDGPGPGDAEFLKTTSVIEKNPRGDRRRRDEGYYAMRREVLQSYHFVTDESEKAGVVVAQRSACATRRRSGMFLRSVIGFARAPAAAKTCCTG